MEVMQAGALRHSRRQLTPNEYTRIMVDAILRRNGLNPAERIGRRFVFAFRLSDGRSGREVLDVVLETLFSFEVFRTVYDRDLNGASVLSLNRCQEIASEVSSSIDLVATWSYKELKRAGARLNVRDSVPFSVSVREESKGIVAVVLCYDHIAVDPIAIGIIHEAIRANLERETLPRWVDVSEIADDRARLRSTEQYRDSARRSGANFVWDESMAALEAVGARDRIERVESTNGSEVRLSPKRWAAVCKEASNTHVLPSVLLLFHLARAIHELGANRYMPLIISTTGRLTAKELRAVCWLSDRVILRIDGSGSQTPAEMQAQYLNEVDDRISFSDAIKFANEEYFGFANEPSIRYSFFSREQAGGDHDTLMSSPRVEILGSAVTGSNDHLAAYAQAIADDGGLLLRFFGGASESTRLSVLGRWTDRLPA